jgi:hypothetical protein
MAGNATTCVLLAFAMPYCTATIDGGEIVPLTAHQPKPTSGSRSYFFWTRAAMIEDEDRITDDLLPPAANDNGNAAALRRINAAVLRIARLIGRQMAREAFERLSATNDNRPPEPPQD